MRTRIALVAITRSPSSPSRSRPWPPLHSRLGHPHGHHARDDPRRPTGRPVHPGVPRHMTGTSPSTPTPALRLFDTLRPAVPPATRRSPRSSRDHRLAPGPADTVTPAQRAAWDPVARCEEGGNWQADGPRSAAASDHPGQLVRLRGSPSTRRKPPRPRLTNRSWSPSASRLPPDQGGCSAATSFTAAAPRGGSGQAPGPRHRSGSGRSLGRRPGLTGRPQQRELEGNRPQATAGSPSTRMPTGPGVEAICRLAGHTATSNAVRGRRAPTCPPDQPAAHTSSAAPLA